eukprot:1302818-Amphidinium_carterae.1
MASQLSTHDCELYSYVYDRGPQGSAGNGIQCLAILVATRHWKHILARPGGLWTLQSDNATALNMVA